MKTKTHKRVTQDRIDQIINDIAEDINLDNHTKHELRAVITVLGDMADKQNQRYWALRDRMLTSLSGLVVEVVKESVPNKTLDVKRPKAVTSARR